MNNKKLNIDPMKEAKRSEYFEQFSKEAKERIRLGVEIYNAREVLGMSQQKLAKEAQTTQKVISRIENGDVNVGFALLSRIASVLNFNYENWSNILGLSIPHRIFFFGSQTESNNQEIKEKVSSYGVSSLSIN